MICLVLWPGKTYPRIWSAWGDMNWLLHRHKGKLKELYTAEFIYQSSVSNFFQFVGLSGVRLFEISKRPKSTCKPAKPPHSWLKSAIKWKKVWKKYAGDIIQWMKVYKCTYVRTYRGPFYSYSISTNPTWNVNSRTPFCVIRVFFFIKKIGTCLLTRIKWKKNKKIAFWFKL